MEDYAFDPRLAYARTAPARWYLDENFLAFEKAKLFSRVWQLVGRADQVAAPHSYFTANIGDEPIIVARGGDGELRAFSNVCRHRAGPVAAGAGQRKSFQCGYHGWTYDLRGAIMQTPEFEGVECFNKEANCLPEFKVEAWGGLVFVNLDANCLSLSDYLEDLPARIMHRNWADMKLALRKDWQVDCNWKVYVDNYLEGYHIPIVHPALNRELDYKKYSVDIRRYYSNQHAPIKRVEDGRIGHGESAVDNEAQFFWIFPNLMLNVYPDNYSTNLIVPLGPTRTLTIFEWYQPDPHSSAAQQSLKRIVEFSDEIQLEDIAICEAVQRGLKSSFYQQGRYSVKRENGVHHFHGLLSEFLNK
jgi:choline monooxygenase